MWQIIKLILMNAVPFIFKWLGMKIEKDKVRQIKKEEALKEVKDGIKTGDNSKITSGFDRLNRI